MGLDMYLSVREYVNRIDFSKGYDEEAGFTETESFNTLVDSMDMRSLVKEGEHAGAYVEIPVMYWRKTNAVHNWFVRELADGVDDCKPIYTTPDRLRELVSLCEQVSWNNSKAEELLPTGTGFFFGGTDYDDNYYADIEHTGNRLRYIVAQMEKKARALDTLVYQASW